MSRSVVAIVPMRHSSERVPGKNYRPFGGRPLYHWIVEALLESRVFDDVVIDTDSPTIRDDCTSTFPGVRLIERPDHLRAGEIPMNDVLLHTTSVFEADYFCQTHSTNPLLRAQTIRNAVDAFLGGLPAADSLFSVTRLQTRLWDQLARPVNHNASILLRTQDLPPIFEENSCVYLFSREVLLRHHNRIGDRPLMWEIPDDEAIDIDVESDFRLAEELLKLRLSSE